ncbi:TPA: hypothetical protein QCR51_005627 [Bacillus cereus]|nr:hypothetical protein [Bacillus cereus]
MINKKILTKAVLSLGIAASGATFLGSATPASAMEWDSRKAEQELREARQAAERYEREQREYLERARQELERKRQEMERRKQEEKYENKGFQW